MKREGINYPKFKDQFAVMDFEAEPMPVLSLFPMPPARPIAAWKIMLTDVASRRQVITGTDLLALPRVKERVPLVCQIFNWTERPEVEGVRLVDLLNATETDAPEDGYYAFYSADGLYFEGLPRLLARDPRVLLVIGINGQPLPSQHGGPVRLWVPFLQGYKSVKWLTQVRVYRKDPVGIKRLLGQSRTAILGAEGQDMVGIVVARPHNGATAPEV